jgi:hypothetical protein
MPNNSKGCCIFAFNTQEIDYLRLARLAADRVTKYLNLPVTIISDQSSVNFGSHDFIIVDKPQRNFRSKKEWLNRGRPNVYDLSPYDRTLVIDSDFFIGTDNLTPHIDSAAPFLIARDLYSPVTGQVSQLTLGNNLTQYWATVMIFSKSVEAQTIFSISKMVEEHYEFYSAIYKFHPYPYRNDHIFSIACHLAGGYGLKSFALKNYPIINCDGLVRYKSWQGNKLVYEYDAVAPSANRFVNCDLHLVNKDHL